MKTARVSAIALASFLAGLSACGGSGGSGGQQTTSIESTAGLDGLVSCQSDPYFVDPVSQTSTFGETTIRIGARHPAQGSDNVVIARALLSFDLGGLAGKTIAAAQLRVHVSSATAAPNDPFDETTGLGALQVDHFTTNYTAETASSLLFLDPTLSTQVPGAMSADQGWRVIDVTDEVVADLGAGRSAQFRLHFQDELNVSSSEKHIFIEAAESEDDEPVLIVTHD